MSTDEPERARRDQLLDEYFRLLGPAPPMEVSRRLDEIERQYRDDLPRHPIARCPHTGELLRFPIDSYGLDGPWWNYQNSVRDWAEYLPTCIAVTGAVHLGATPRPVPFLAVPGPEVPFVVPRLLERPGMTAVISHLAVGEHDGYPISYFESPPPRDIVRYNEWGADRYWYTDANGVWGWDQIYEDSERIDFDLEPWVAAGKLLWVQPGDDTAQLRHGTGGFPFSGVEGRHSYVRIQNGRVWEPGGATQQQLLDLLRRPPDQ
jgi:hypothetical protein